MQLYMCLYVLEDLTYNNPGTALVSPARSSRINNSFRCSTFQILTTSYRYGPRDVGRREEFSMKGKLSCDFQFLPFAGTLRRPPGEVMFFCLVMTLITYYRVMCRILITRI